jgi:hypothetical protein
MDLTEKIKGLTSEVRFQSKDCYGLADEAAKLVADNDLESLLNELCKYGEPRVSMLRGGWYCKIEMHVSQKGCSFDVASEFKCETPTHAARECLSRVKSALKDLGV